MACIAKRCGRYVIDCYDQNGKRYRKTMRAGTTKDAAKKELLEIETRKVGIAEDFLERKVGFINTFLEDFSIYLPEELRESFSKAKVTA